MKPKKPFVSRVTLEQTNEDLAKMMKDYEDERNAHVASIRDLAIKCAALEGALQADKGSYEGKTKALDNENEELKKCIKRLQSAAKDMINIMGNSSGGRFWGI